MSMENVMGVGARWDAAVSGSQGWQISGKPPWHAWVTEVQMDLWRGILGASALYQRLSHLACVWLWLDLKCPSKGQCPKSLWCYQEVMETLRGWAWWKEVGSLGMSLRGCWHSCCFLSNFFPAAMKWSDLLCPMPPPWIVPSPSRATGPRNHGVKPLNP